MRPVVGKHFANSNGVHIDRAKRKARKRSQEELAEELGIAPKSLQAIEQGRRFPSLPMLFYILSVMQIDFKLE